VHSANLLFQLGDGLGNLRRKISGGRRQMKRMWIWIGGSLGAVLVGGFVGLSFMAGSPKDVYGMVRYALPHMHRGNLNVGDAAPDARVLALDGTTGFQVRKRMNGRPLVLVFGSFT
jgi:hypothetical protein